jgi:tRNA U34 5-methylaminomethyl-2-thiouridine-forming methyltransferase MnmC
MLRNAYKIIITDDGSTSLQIEKTEITFHSKRGAIQESQHIFINAGLKYFCERNPKKEKIQLFEMGFGSGLNAFLTAIFAHQTKQKIDYTTIDAYPLNDIFSQLNYTKFLGEAILFNNIVNASWNEEILISDFFTLTKIKSLLQDFSFEKKYDIIFFDAFAPTDQPELWTKEIFSRLYDALHNEGILVTYSSRSAVRKALQESGFFVEKLRGPLGKREIVRALKN